MSDHVWFSPQITSIIQLFIKNKMTPTPPLLGSMIVQLTTAGHKMSPTSLFSVYMHQVIREPVSRLCGLFIGFQSSE